MISGLSISVGPEDNTSAGKGNFPQISQMTQIHSEEGPDAGKSVKSVLSVGPEDNTSAGKGKEGVLNSLQLQLSKQEVRWGSIYNCFHKTPYCLIWIT